MVVVEGEGEVMEVGGGEGVEGGMEGGEGFGRVVEEEEGGDG